MNNNPLIHNGEIDIIEIFQTIWDGKIKIIFFTLLLLSIGIGYSYKNQLPPTYEVSIKINPANSSEFIKFLPLNDMIIDLGITENEKNITVEPNNVSQMYTEIFYNRFIKELMDYDELTFVLKKNPSVKDKINKLSKTNSQIKLYSLTNLFSLEKNDEKNDEMYKSSHILKFRWNDGLEGKEILSEILNLSIINLKKNIFKDLENLLEVKRNLKITKDSNQIDFLSEQSDIAKELEISENQYTSVNPSVTNLSLNVDTSNINYYLRGYRAIDKEISIIKNRKYNDLLAIEKKIEYLKNETNMKWVDFNLYLIDVKTIIKNEKTPFVTLIVLGLIIGVFFVLITKTIKIHKAARTKTE